MTEIDMLKKWQDILPTLNDDGLKLLEHFIGRLISENDRYTTTDPDRLQKYRQREKERAEADAKEQEEFMQRQKEIKACEAEKTAFEAISIYRLYRRNRTMEMLGQQDLAMIFCDEEIDELFEDLRAAHRYDFSFNNAVDGFLLGFICGKRKERARRKRGQTA